MLKEIHKEMTVEMVEKLMGETEDAVAYQRVSSASPLLTQMWLGRSRAIWAQGDD